MNRLVILFIILFSVNTILSSQTDDDNIIITDKDVVYEYVIDKNSVVVKEKSNVEYETAKRRDNTTIYEIYDNESTLDKVKVKGIKDEDPVYRMYRSNDFFYSDAKVCEISLYFDKKGKKGTVEIEKTYKDPRYFTIIPLSETQYIKSGTVRIIVPQWMKVEFVDYNFGKNIKKEILTNQKDNSTIYVYTIENQKPMAGESLMQGPTFIYPHILVLNKRADAAGTETVYFETLADQYAWYKHLTGQIQNDDNIIAAKAKEIAANCKTDLDKIKEIYAWVQTNIRYVAFEDGIAGYKPENAQEVLRKKYGDCKGMSNLVKALLEAEGFDARLTWLGTNHIAHDYSTPALSVDNHMICTVFYNGETYFLDPTYEYMPLGECPQSIQGRQVMIEDKDKFILERIPISLPQMNTDSLYCKFAIGDGKMEGQAARYFMGESKERILSLINATPKDKIDIALKYFLEHGNLQDKATGVVLKDASPLTESTYITYHIENKSGVQNAGNELYIGMNQTQDLGQATIDIKKRKSNMLLDYRYRTIRQTELIIPQGYTLTHTPENMMIDRGKYVFKITYTPQDNILIYRCELIINDPLIEKSSFEQWNTDVNELTKNYMEQIVLTAK